MTTIVENYHSTVSSLVTVNCRSMTVMRWLHGAESGVFQETIVVLFLKVSFFVATVLISQDDTKPEVTHPGSNTLPFDNLAKERKLQNIDYNLPQKCNYNFISLLRVYTSFYGFSELFLDDHAI